MRKRTVAGLLTAAAFMTCGMAGAQTLAQRDAIAQDKVNLAEYSKRVNSACGTHINFSVNYASYQQAPGGVNEQAHAPYLILENAGDAIMNVCKSESGKQSVQEKIKSVVGVYTEGEEESLSAGVFTYKAGYHGAQTESVERWLKSHL